MSEVVMTIIAVIAIIALVGLIIALMSVVSAVQGIIGSGKAGAKIIDRPKNAALRIVDTGKSIGRRSSSRVSVIGVHVKSAAASVNRIKSDLADAAEAAKPKAKASKPKAADMFKNIASKFKKSKDATSSTSPTDAGAAA